MENTKITKKVILEAIKELANQDPEGMFNDLVSAADVISFADTMIAQLDAKAAKAKERAAKNKAEGDELRAAVEGVLTDDLQTIDAITTAVNAIEGYEDITKSKVTARLTQLVKSEKVEKEQIKLEDGRKVMAYRLFTGEDAE